MHNWGMTVTEPFCYEMQAWPTNFSGKLSMPIFLKILHIVWQLILERRQTDGGPFLHPEERQKVKHTVFTRVIHALL